MSVYTQTNTDKFTTARTQLVLDHPFFGSLALKLEPVLVPTLHGAYAATDGVHIYYPYDRLETARISEVRSDIAHEVMHCALGHIFRRGSRNMRKWNVACDHAVNLVLKDNGFCIPENVYCDAQYKDMYAEQIYSMVPEDPSSDQQFTVQINQDDGGNTSVTITDGDGKEVDDIDVQDIVIDADKADSGESAQEIEAEWKVSTIQAAKTAKVCGREPAGVDRLVTELSAPKVYWADKFKVFVDTTARNDFNWKLPNQRYAHQGIYLPSLISDHLPKIAIGVDTSGSVTRNDLKQVAGDISEILDTYDTTVDVAYCDSKIQCIETFDSGEPVVLNAKGGGGTDFKPFIDHYNQEDDPISCLVIFTDMCCTSFGEEPDYPVLWVKTYNTPQTPPYGDVIDISDGLYTNT